MNKTIHISVAKDFTVTPGARYRTDGKYSGQEFYEEILKPALSAVWGDNNSKIVLDLDGTFKYASSFISEIFIRVVKDFNDKEKIIDKIHFISNDEPILIDSILEIINEAKVE